MSPIAIGALILLGMFGITFLIAALMFPKDLTPEEEEELAKQILQQINDPSNPAVY